MPQGPLAGVTAVENASCISGPSAGLLRGADVAAAINRTDEVAGDRRVRETGLLRHARGPAGESFLVPRGAIAFAGDIDACSMEVPVLGG